MIVGGVLSPIENLLTEVLIWLHETGGLTWAWSIVALTVLVRVLLVPVAIRQIHSMQSLQIHAPEMKAIQQRYKSDRQKQSEELMKFYKENKINPYASCLPIVFQIPIFIALFFVLRDFDEEVYPRFEETTLEWLNLVDITEPTKDGWGPLLLVVYVISQLTSTYLMSTSMQSAAQRWLIMLLPIVFIPFILSFPSGLMIYWLTTNLWTTGQGHRHAPSDAATRASTQAVEPDSAEGGGAAEPAAAGDGDGDAAPTTGSARPHRPAAPRQAQARRREKAMSDGANGTRVEATGETVGEAKWTALRELEQLVPGLDRETVQFDVLSEGERGLLGVGFTPARVVATVPEAARNGVGRERGGGVGSRVRPAHRRRDRGGRDGLRGREGGSGHGDVHGRRPRPPDRQARPDDRRDPVPRERRRSRGGRRARGRRRRGRVPRAPHLDAGSGRGALGPPRRRDRETRWSSTR